MFRGPFLRACGKSAKAKELRCFLASRTMAIPFSSCSTSAAAQESAAPVCAANLLFAQQGKPCYNERRFFREVQPWTRRDYRRRCSRCSTGFRRTRAPWQRARVEAVRGYYARFLAAAPDVFALAALPEAQLLKLWEGLGYYNRAPR